MIISASNNVVRRLFVGAALLASAGSLLRAQPAMPLPAAATAIPLPEHPRPDFQRPDWVNLNGTWNFKFDGANTGESGRWYGAALPAPHAIRVPFSWGAPLSGVADSADIGWYQRTVRVPAAWRGKRVFLVVGASDWKTSVWLDGTKVGEHQGGYTPFSVELTSSAKLGSDQRLTLRVDDSPHPFKLEGKQGYGKARGMWQTVYLEARGADPLQYVHFTPDIAGGRVRVEARLEKPAPRAMSLRLGFTKGADSIVNGGVALPVPVVQAVAAGARTVNFDVALPSARLWSPEDPYLYEVALSLSGPGVATDSVHSYFGMREISVVNLPGTTIPYVALNGKPVYMQLSLDQAYHPAGFYTFPTDSILRNEILQARLIGLTGLREHIKIEAPRKLYWADKLGVLIMADVPNWWGPPDSASFAEHDYAMREMIERDYNHPSIFSWVTYNEAWGIVSKVNGRDVYTPEAQRDVIRSWREAKRLDPTRLVEDNSPCCGRGHTETDLNSWHEYLPGFNWERRVTIISDSTFPGSPWNFEKGYAQKSQPMFNSEFGNVWGYKGSSGDVDWSWDYHLAVNAFRRHPKMAGWLYTELDDVINEWNGYWRFDRTRKETGLGELVPGMTLNDLHSAYYVVVGKELGTLARVGETVQVPLYASFLADGRAHGDSLTLKFDFYGWNALGERKTWSSTSRRIANRPWMTEALAPQPVTMPNENAVGVFATTLEDASGALLQHNFTTFVVGGGTMAELRNADGRRVVLSRVNPAAYTAAQWSQRSWTVMDSMKVNGAGTGYFEYRLPWPAGVKASDVSSASFLVEASAKRLLGKDRDTLVKDNGDYMRGGGLQDPSRNRNAYPMTGETAFPSAITVRINGESAGHYLLADDPADHRGILSWASQSRDGYLREAGSYGEMIRVPLSAAALASGQRDGAVVVRLEVDGGIPGGLAIYGAHFGRYPVDPSVAFIMR